MDAAINPTSGISAPPTPPPPNASQTLAAAQSGSAPLTTTTAPSPMVQNPAAATPDRDLPKDSWGAKIYHGVLGALGGTNQVSFQRDPATGKMIATQAKIGPGQQWKNIIAGALTGYAGAAATGAHGPGSTSAKIGAGFQAGQQRVQQQYDRQRAEANEDFEAQQKTATANLQRSLLTLQGAHQALDNKMMGIKLSEDAVDRENWLADSLASAGEGQAVDMGVLKDRDTALQKMRDDPTLHEKLAGMGPHKLIGIAHVDADGKADGFHWAVVTEPWLQRMNDTAFEVTDAMGNKHTIEANSVNNDKMTTFIMQSGVNEFNKQKANQAEQDRQRKEEDTKLFHNQTLDIERQRLALAQKVANADAGDVAPGGDVFEDATAGLAAGRYVMDKDIPKRMTKNPTLTMQLNKSANDKSMQKYGLPYSPEQIRQESHFATSPSTQGFLNSADSMIGDPVTGMPGQLDQLIDAAKKAKLGNQFGPVGQSLWQQLKNVSGSTAASGYLQLLSDTQTKLGPLVGNPLLGHSDSDKKLEKAEQQLSSVTTLDQLITHATNAKMVLEDARMHLALRNRYVQERYGGTYLPPQPYSQGGTQPGAGAPPPPQAGAGVTPPPAGGGGKPQYASLAALKQSGRFNGMTDDQIKQAAAAKGITVNQ